MIELVYLMSTILLCAAGGMTWGGTAAAIAAQTRRNTDFADAEFYCLFWDNDEFLLSWQGALVTRYGQD